MLEFFRNLLNSQTFFERFVRGVLAAAGTYGGAVGWFPPEVAAAMTGGALFIGAGEKNQP